MIIDFGIVEHIEARATGSPGQRTFQIRILGEAGQSASLKLEKEQLLGLRMGLYELLAKTRHKGKPEVVGVVYFPPTPDYDFPVGQLGIGFLDADTNIVLEVHQLETEGDQETIVIRARFTPDQGASVSGQLDEIIAAGRPLCSLCKTPIDPAGHMCTKSNGHSRHPIPDDSESEG